MLILFTFLLPFPWCLLSEPGADQSFWVLTLSQRAILFLIARLGYMSPHKIGKLVPWLQENPRHPISYYVLLLAAFDLIDPQTPEGVPRTEELETNIWNAVQGNAFTFLAGSVAKLCRGEGSFPSGSYAGSVIRFSEADQL